MILADTNIIIDFWDKPTDDAKKIFEENEIATCGVIKTELLRGSNSDNQFLQMEEALNDFTYLSFKEKWTCSSISRCDNFISCYKI